MTNGAASGSNGGTTLLGANDLQSSIDSLNTSVQQLAQSIKGGAGGGGGATSPFMSGLQGKINWGSNGGGATFSGAPAGSAPNTPSGSANVLGTSSGSGNGGVGGLLGNMAGLGANLLFKSNFGFQSTQQAATNAITYGTLQSMWSTTGSSSGVLKGAGGKAGMYGSQGPTDFFGGLSVLQSLGGWTSGTQFKDMQSAIGGAQMLNPTMSYSQVASSVGQFAAMPQTNALRNYGINTYQAGKFTGSIQSIASQLMTRMGINPAGMTPQQVQEEGGPNSPLAQQLSMMVSSGAMDANQAQLVRQQIMAYIQGSKKGMSTTQVDQGQANYANTGKSGSMNSLGYGKSSLASLQHVLAQGTSKDMDLSDAGKALSTLAAGASDFSSLLGSIAGLFGGGGIGGAIGGALSGVGSGIKSGIKDLGKVGSSFLGGSPASAAEASPKVLGSSSSSSGAWSSSMTAASVTGMTNKTGSQPNSCLKDLALAILGGPSGYTGGPHEAWAAVPASHKHPGDKNPPAGAIVYWDRHGSNAYGHIGVALGNGQFRSAGLSDHWEDHPMSWESSNYLGWADMIGTHHLPYKITASSTKGAPPAPSQFSNKFGLGAPKKPQTAGGTLSQDQIYQLALGAGLSPSAAKTASAIAMAESMGGNPNAMGDLSLEDRKWGASEGLWQIRSLKSQNGTGATRDPSRLLDPAFNAKSMAQISSGGTDWTAWSTYNHGDYKSFMNFTPNSINVHIHGSASRSDASALANGFVDELAKHHRLRTLQAGGRK